MTRTQNNSNNNVLFPPTISTRRRTPGFTSRAFGSTVRTEKKNSTTTTTTTTTKKKERRLRSFSYSYSSTSSRVNRKFWRNIKYYAVITIGWVILLALVGILSNDDTTDKSINKNTNYNEWNSYHDDFPMSENQQQQLLQQQPLNSVFTSLTTEEGGKLKEMKNIFEARKKSNKNNGDDSLLPCRLDQIHSCFEAKGIWNFLRRPMRKYKLLLHNPLDEDRFWNGKRIMGGGGILIVDSYAHIINEERSLPYVYAKNPPFIPKVEGNTSNGEKKRIQVLQQQPVELFWNSDSPVRDFPCSVPCKTNDNFMIVNSVYIRNTKWTITLSMEGEYYYPEVHVQAAAYRNDIYYATTSFKSDIPVPYFSWKEYNIQHPAVDFHNAIHGASFLANNCDTKNGREILVKDLIETELRVDSLSSCLNNAEPLLGVDMENKTAVMERYLFHLAFENQNTDDYITEKLWLALQAGTLPVYMGAKNVKTHVPSHSIINVHDYASTHDLAEYLITVSNNETLYNSYHSWRYRPIDTIFANKYEFAKVHSTCRICKWAFAKRHGLGWNHTKQEIAQPYIDHKTCRNKIGLIGHPFKEYWLLSERDGADQVDDKVRVTSTDDTRSCKLNDKNRVIQIDGGAVQRKVYDTDGVTDFLIDRVPKGDGNTNTTRLYILCLEMPIIIESNYKPHKVNASVWWLQNSRSRMYVMTSNGSIRLSPYKSGMLEILMPLHGRSRVRIVTEDRDIFHQKTKNICSYFGDLMMRDFFTPIESYRI